MSDFLLNLLWVVGVFCGCVGIWVLPALCPSKNPYFHIACLMQMEGYTDFEIDQEIYELKKANGDLNEDDSLA